MKLIEHYIMSGICRLVVTLVGFLTFIFACYCAQRYLTEAANGTLALGVVLNVVFYKVLIALEMLLPVGLYVSVGITLGQMYTDSEMTAIAAAGATPSCLYRAVMVLAIPLSILVTILSLYGRPWAYAQIYQLEQQSQSALDVHHLQARKFNVNNNGRMILARQIDSGAAHLNDALIYTASDNKTSIFRANSVDVVDPSSTTPAVMLHSGTAYVLDHQGSNDNEQVFRNLRLNLKPLDQKNEVKRKAKSVETLTRASVPADIAELQWRESRGVCALFMALLAVPLSRVKPRQGRFSTLLPLTLLFVIIFYGGNICRTLVANGALPVTPGLWLIPLLILIGFVILLVRDGTLRWKTYK
ncbi:LPS export ABC transporter permease LptF [Citrobacter sp. ku-bf4]|uniref:LPS export ABC transporter permease LptF n=1 Tax=Citrobacter TaxID=544 RepID=UPI00197D5BFD|nr:MULTISPECIES: LPS export ABC transporter permease LptF [Citrobacter]MBN6043595.1 LPS export ABC transporter permease LptF [Citrobacter sp. ku-bf4]MBS0824972.1 LPS export ABC transporter permease LptF [Citrobacter amalonaticus]